jgi:hypothetical protein
MERSSRDLSIFAMVMKAVQVTAFIFDDIWVMPSRPSMDKS